MKINWRERFFAAAIHFLVTAALAGIAAAIVFLVWFPDGLADVIGGRTLFFMVIAIDASLGPLISLVIYSSKKSRKQLIVDYSVIGIVQLAALCYGLFAVAVSRPVFVVYHGARLEIVTAIELNDEDLVQGSRPEYQSRSWLGPRQVSVKMPTDMKERNDLVFSAVGGKDAQLMPKYFREYDAAFEDLKSNCQPMSSVQMDAAAKTALDGEIKATSHSADELCWLQTHHRFGFGMVIVDQQSNRPLRYLALDPFAKTK